MYFEVYLDSLFALQFIMNLLLLSLVNSMMKGRVSERRVVLGAAGAAVFSILLLLIPFNMFFTMSIGMFFTAFLMGLVTFKINKWNLFLKFMEKLSISTLLLGGLSLLILRLLPKGTDACGGLTMVLVVVGISFWIIRKICSKKENHHCRVTLYGEEEVEVEALIDTGNTLIEPISSKPVSVLDKKIFDRVFPGYEKGFRMVPYHSVGKQHGMMQAYLLSCIKVETDDSCMECHDIYVGLSEESLLDVKSYKMILNPQIFR